MKRNVANRTDRINQQFRSAERRDYNEACVCLYELKQAGGKKKDSSITLYAVDLE